MKDCEGMKVSLLHAAPAFSPFYQSVGYVHTESLWTLIPVDTSTLLLLQQHSPEMVVRPAKFPEDTPVLMELHQTYSEHRFAGCILRSQDYWSNYVSQELQGSLWVVIIQQGSNKEESILGWLSIRPRGVDDNNKTRYQLREFGCSTPSVNAHAAMGRLLATAMEAETAQDASFLLLLPTLVLQDVQESYTKSSATNASTPPSCFDFSRAVDENDQGWMYKQLSKDDDSVVSAITQGENKPPHLIWPTDSF
jgi:hypothetical protein